MALLSAAQVLEQLSDDLSEKQRIIRKLQYLIEKTPCCFSAPAIDQSTVQIIPRYILERERELRQLGEALDRRYADLQVQEQLWLRLYRDFDQNRHHDEILRQLDVIRQEMTYIQLQFESPSNGIV